MTMANVDYWRTFRDFETNASVIADQPQDVVTFKGGDNIRLSFNEGDDVITWHADISGITADVTANLSIVNADPATPSMLDYEPTTGTFTYYPPDLSDYATISYVQSAVANGVANIDLSGYATEKWVEGYVGTAVNIPDTDDFVRKDQYNKDYANVYTKIEEIPAGPQGEQGPPGSSVKIVGSVENYEELTTLPRWTNYLGQLGDGVIIRNGGTIEFLPGSGDFITIEDGTLAVAVNLLYPPTSQTLWDPTPGQILGYTGSRGAQGDKGDIGYTGSRGESVIMGLYTHEQNVASTVWTINHNLGVQYLSVELIDDQSNSIVGTYDYPTVTFIDDYNLTVTWKYAATGYAVLSAGGGETGNTGFNGSRGFTGSRGFDGSTGAPLRVIDNVPTIGDLPNPYTGQVKDAYIVNSNGHAYLCEQLNPAVWNDIGQWVGYTGSASTVVGYTGSQGDSGLTANLQIVTSNGNNTSNDVIVGNLSINNSYSLPSAIGSDREVMLVNNGNVVFGSHATVSDSVDVTLNVGSGQDFATLDDAFKYIMLNRESIGWVAGNRPRVPRWIVNVTDTQDLGGADLSLDSIQGSVQLQGSGAVNNGQLWIINTFFRPRSTLSFTGLSIWTRNQTNINVISGGTNDFSGIEWYIDKASFIDISQGDTFGYIEIANGSSMWIGGTCTIDDLGVYNGSHVFCNAGVTINSSAYVSSGSTGSFQDITLGGTLDCTDGGFIHTGIVTGGTLRCGGGTMYVQDAPTSTLTPSVFAEFGSIIVTSTTATAESLINIGNHIPTSDPGIAGCLWNDSGTLKIS